MRLRQFRLRTLMIVIAFLALFIVVIIQGIQLQRTTAREQLLRAEAERMRLDAERAALWAEQLRDQAQASLDGARARYSQQLLEKRSRQNAR
jgi:hypothetical protein